MALELKYVTTGGMEQIIPLSQPTLVVGSLASNQVVLLAEGVEPIHGILSVMIQEIGMLRIWARTRAFLLMGRGLLSTLASLPGIRFALAQ